MIAHCPDIGVASLNPLSAVLTQQGFGEESANLEVLSLHEHARQPAELHG